MSESPLVASVPLFTYVDGLYQASLERAADQLLYAKGAEPPGAYPYHRERRLQMLRRHGQRVVAPPEAAPPEEATRRRALLRLVGRLPFTPRQRLVFRLTMRGYPRARIAHLLGVTPRSVSNLNWATCSALAEVTPEHRDLLLSPSVAVQETYRAEVARRGYVREKHCAPGREDCRRTGVCTRRWYLYFAPEAPQAPGGR